MKEKKLLNLSLTVFQWCLTGVCPLWDAAALCILRLCDPIVSLVFSLLSGGKCDKVGLFSPPLASVFDCLCSQARWSPPAAGGGLGAHRRLFYARLQEGQIQNQWGNSSAALNSISAKHDPLRGAGISGTPNGRIVNMTERGEERGESCYSCEMWNAQV